MNYYRYKIVLFGDDDSCKTELREKYIENMFDDDNKMTLGVEFAIKTIEIDEAKIKFEIWDLSSEERFKDLIPSFVLSARGAILIIKMPNDIMLSKLREEVLNVKDRLSSLKNGPIPIVILGIRDDSVVTQSKDSSEGIAIAQNIGVDIFRVCRIKDKEAIDSIFQQLGRILVNQTLEELAKEEREGSILPGSRLYGVPEESSKLFDWIVGIGIAVMVIVVAIISLYVAYIRNL